MVSGFQQMLLEIDRLSFPVPLEATRHLRAPGVQLRHQSVGKKQTPYEINRECVGNIEIERCP